MRQTNTTTTSISPQGHAGHAKNGDDRVIEWDFLFSFIFLFRDSRHLNWTLRHLCTLHGTIFRNSLFIALLTLAGRVPDFAANLSRSSVLCHLFYFRHAIHPPPRSTCVLCECEFQDSGRSSFVLSTVDGTRKKYK